MPWITLTGLVGRMTLMRIWYPDEGYVGVTMTQSPFANALRPTTSESSNQAASSGMQHSTNCAATEVTFLDLKAILVVLGWTAAARDRQVAASDDR